MRAALLFSLMVCVCLLPYQGSSLDCPDMEAGDRRQTKTIAALAISAANIVHAFQFRDEALWVC